MGNELGPLFSTFIVRLFLSGDLTISARAGQMCLLARVVDVVCARVQYHVV